MTVPTSVTRVDIRGAALAVTDAGADTLPVAINAHGLMSSRAAAKASGIGDFSAVGAVEGPGGHRRLVSYDARGHGESSGSTTAADYEWPNLARDVLALADVFSPTRPVADGSGTWKATYILNLPGQVTSAQIVLNNILQSSATTASTSYIEKKGISVTAVDPALVPEPASMAILVICGGFAIRRRRATGA